MEEEAAPTALALAIKKVRRRVGSHDKFAALLKDVYGLDKAGRAVVINWEKKNAVPSGRYRDALIDLGVDSSLFANPEPATQPAPIAVMLEALENQRAMKARLDEMDSRLESLLDGIGQVAEGVADALALLQGGQAPGQAGRG